MPRTEDPTRESGVPISPAPYAAGLAEGSSCFDLALSEHTRAEANLKLLLRGAQQVLAGVSAARDANAFLGQQLESLRVLLEQSTLRERLLMQRVRLLEETLENVRAEAARERASLVAEDDAFLAELLADHEREIARLRETLVPPAMPVPARSDAERDTVRPLKPARTAIAAIQLKSVWSVDLERSDDTTSKDSAGEAPTTPPPAKR